MKNLKIGIFILCLVVIFIINTDSFQEQFFPGKFYANKIKNIESHITRLESDLKAADKSIQFYTDLFESVKDSEQESFYEYLHKLYETEPFENRDSLKAKARRYASLYVSVYDSLLERAIDKKNEIHRNLEESKEQLTQIEIKMRLLKNSPRQIHNIPLIVIILIITSIAVIIFWLFKSFYTNKIETTKKVIIILDDEYQNREMLKDFLEIRLGDSQIEIIVTGDVEYAREVIENKEGLVDIISTDINHPGINGLTFSEQIKRKYPDIKIIICTGHDSSEKKEQAEKVSDFFFRKPIPINEFIDTINSCLKFNKYASDKPNPKEKN